MQLALADRSRGFVYIARKVDPQRVAKLKEAGDRRARLRRRGAARVPAHACRVTGARLRRNGQSRPRGLELGLEKVLAGKAGSETIIRDPTGRAIDILSSTAAEEGQNVTLTLDHTIQAQAEAVLRKTIDRLDANSASAIVLDPRTGGILAMAVERGYDANRFPIVPRTASATGP